MPDKKNRREPWIFVFWAIVAWRVWCLVFLILGMIYLPQQKDFLGGGSAYLVKPYLWAWANFDGEHYLAIAQHGYGGLEQAFFPLYPYLVRWFAGVDWTSLEGLLISGLLVSHVAFYFGLVWLYKLVQLDYDRKVAEWAILALLVAPASFFFGAVYTESLFLFLSVGCLWAARKNRWWMAGVLGAIASSARVVGILLLPALVAEWLWQRKKEGKCSRWNLLPIGISVSGLVLYMRMLSNRWNDALYFLHAQPYFGAGRSVDKLILLYQVFWRYAKMLVTVEWHSLAYYTVLLELGSAVIFLFLVLVSAWRQRWSYAVFAGLTFLVPTLTGTFSSLPRYVLVIFPAFILLGEGMAKWRWLGWVYVLVSGVLLGVTCALFTRGFWVG